MKYRSTIPFALFVIACSTPRNEPSRQAPAESERAPATPANVQEVVPPAREVRIRTSDGVTLVGTLQPGARPDAPLVIFVHQIAGNRDDFAPLLSRLHASPSIATLTFDMRGHGASTEGPDGVLSFRDFDRDMWAGTIEDVIAVRSFVDSSESGIHPARVAIVGASMGSTAAIAGAATMETIDAIVALSPGRAYHGVDAIMPSTRLGRGPFLAVAVRSEAESVETAEAMARITSGEALVSDHDGHGTAMLAQSEEVLAHVERFVRRSLQAEDP